MSTSPHPTALSTEERIDQLERQFTETQATLQAQSRQMAEMLRQLTAMNAPVCPTTPTDRPATPDQNAPFVSRRSMLKQAAMATLGAAAVLETMPSARATDNSALLVGETNTSAVTTQLSSTASTAPAMTVINSNGGSGLKGTSTSGSGIYGTSSSGYGVYGMTSSAIAVAGRSSSNYGIYGVSDSSTAVVGSSSSGSGVYGKTAGAMASGVAGVSPYVGVSGVSGDSQGIAGTGIGLVGMAEQYGASLFGARAPLLLNTTENNVTNPNSDVTSHLAGELFVDASNRLWYCVTSGVPGVWRKLAGSGTAGTLVLFTAPTRFLDTRHSSPSYTATPAPVAGAVTTYRFSGTQALVPYTPQGSTAPTIPFGATALLGRFTVLSGTNSPAVGGTFKASNVNVNPLGFGSGLVNWGNTLAVQIAPFTLALNNTDISGAGVLYCQNASTNDVIDLVVDVTGYYY